MFTIFLKIYVNYKQGALGFDFSVIAFFRNFLKLMKTSFFIAAGYEKKSSDKFLSCRQGIGKIIISTQEIQSIRIIWLQFYNFFRIASHGFASLCCIPP